ncbi:hypothetical protein P280DRAFT_387885 [Massarina eburnea CBS 473.64]|uniref:Uncharacterized protein n=1 Tax=Massarina eburnea CBS 473.64 TaxID=1395130 RepID=A0A6A6SFG0_9PLEO|nr:hypothetical protein P280DRAFT_387885 [Massarina eburnea CBS 473.64]
MQETVLNTPLLQHSTRSSLPMASRALPSDMKAGFCDSQSPIAAQLTQSFLDFTSKNGTNLKQLGIRPGQKWCLSADHWKEAAERDAGGEGVPRVSLESTHQAALEKVELETLKKYGGVGSARYAYSWGGK